MIIRLIKSLVIFFVCMLSVAPFGRAQYYDDQTEAELISLDIKGMDMDDVLKILSQKSGLNIVADKDVKGTVALYLTDVDIMDVLDIVVSTNDLAYEREGTLVRVMTMEKYKKLHGKKFKDITATEIIKLSHASASDVYKFINRIKTEEGKIISDERSNMLVLIDTPNNITKMKEIISKVDIPLSTEVFSLDYAKAEKIKEKLEPMTSEYYGSIKFDERTNKLIVEAPSERIEEIRRVIEAFDEKMQELIIDANIIRLSLSKEYSFGVDWRELEKLEKLSLISGGGQKAALSEAPAFRPESAEGLTIAETGSDYSTMVNLFKTFGKVDVLSRPRIGVSDREESSILVGSKEAYVTSEVTTTSGGTYHTADHVKFLDVGIKLVVRPEINKLGYIKLKIRPEVSDIDPAKAIELKNPDGSTRAMVPSIATSEAETTVLVKDGATIIISGLMKDILADRRQKEKTELIIFLTPHIVKEAVETREAARVEISGEAGAKIEEPVGPGLEKAGITVQGEEKKEATHKLEPAEKKTRPKSETKKKSLWSALFGPRPEKEKQRKVEGKEAGAKIEEPVGLELEKVEAEKKTLPKSAAKKKSHWALLFGSRPEKENTREVKESVEVPVASVKKMPYEEYYLRVREEINSFAEGQDVEGLKGEVELQFTLDRHGFLTRGPIVLNKPDLKLVRAAVNCVKKVSPFPPFTRGMPKEETEFNVVVRYE